MLCIHSRNNDVFFNLAAEEYLVKNSSEEIFMLWQSQNSVVVGKHQNTLSEINYRYVKENNIHVARRLSGGGAVFHGPGNLNFTFIRNGEPGKLVDFRRFMLPVIDFLRSLGIDARQGLKNEILLDGKKISGNAEHVFKNRVMHHGTLLFTADLNLLRNSIETTPGKYTDRAVPSNRSSVRNIADNLKPTLNVAAFASAFFDFGMKMSGGERYDFNETEIGVIRQLISAKFNTWDWIYGWSPQYEMHQVLEAKNPMEISIKVKRGIIEDCILKSPAMPDEYLLSASNAIIGCRHEFNEIANVIEGTGLDKILEKELREVVYAFF